MHIEFSGKIIFWRGPSPFFFVKVPAKHSLEIKSISNAVTYGWGVIPVHVRIGRTEFTTSLFPKDGRYLVPIKASVRKAEKLDKDDKVTRLIAITHLPLRIRREFLVLLIDSHRRIIAACDTKQFVKS